jgi:hypothetical protein
MGTNGSTSSDASRWHLSVPAATGMADAAASALEEGSCVEVGINHADHDATSASLPLLTASAERVAP